MKHFVFGGLLLHSLPPGDDSEPGRHRHVHQHIRIRRARVLICLMVLTAAVLNVVLYTHLPHSLQPRAIGLLIASMLWMVALLAGVWLRQKLARFLLALFMALESSALLLLLPTIIDLTRESGGIIAPWAVGALGGFYALFAWLLIASHDFKRLTNRGFEMGG